VKQQIKCFAGVTDVEWFEKKEIKVKDMIGQKEVEKECL